MPSERNKTISNHSIALSDCFPLSNKSPLRSSDPKSEKVVSFSVTPLSTAITQPTSTTDGSEGIKSTRTKRNRSLPPIITPSTKIRVDSPILTRSQSQPVTPMLQSQNSNLMFCVCSKLFYASDCLFKGLLLDASNSF